MKSPPAAVQRMPVLRLTHVAFCEPPRPSSHELVTAQIFALISSLPSVKSVSVAFSAVAPA